MKKYRKYRETLNCTNELCIPLFFLVAKFCCESSTNKHATIN